jgi:hypothetical protein
MKVSDNFLDGTLPAPLLEASSFSVPGSSLNLNGNYFTGPVPSFENYTSLSNFRVVGENMTLDWCAQDPHFMLAGMRCFLPDDGPYVCTCQAFWDCEPNLASRCSIVPQSYDPNAPEAAPAMPVPRNPVRVPDSSCLSPPPSASPSIVPAACFGAAPGPLFTCQNGFWTSPAITAPSITFPPGTFGTILIQGNLNLTDGGIVINGFDTQVLVNGCIFIGDNTVTIELTEEQLKQLEDDGTTSKTLLTAFGACQGSSDLKGTQIIIKKPAGSKSCQKVNTDNSASSQASLVVAFNADFKSCNTKWIILGSVLGAIVVLAIVFALLATLTPLKYVIRPHAKRAESSKAT